MITHDGAAPDRTDANLLGISLLSDLASVIDIRLGIVHLIVYRICQRKRCAAGRIQLRVVELLHNLHIKSRRRQSLRSLL